MHLVCSDLEGIFLPEIWIKFAEKTGIQELRLTTRDISDYDVLMKHRLKILKDRGLKLPDIQAVIAAMDPHEGALGFLEWIRSVTQVLVVSDTFVEFAGPLMKKLGYPTLLCNTLTVAADGTISDYRLRQTDGKRKVAEAMRGLNYRVIGVGDSYNDISMLTAADHGILYRPPDNVRREYPSFPVATGFAELKAMIATILRNGG
ncbi:MAG: bifunctional phosphoserine phosphatase/homoserine phosphotransferase ThrH [Desulfobacterales bacterium]|jgi:phosphoserine/homoserine phosphotransferase|nr:bifunctional phosphoserine phosphatase/homoserine phosphotransferase ThrH [Desulfobacterales bacterium]